MFKINHVLQIEDEIRKGLVANTPIDPNTPLAETVKTVQTSVRTLKILI